jgi:hypothetical protein
MDGESRIIDPVFECDAPTYVDFEKVKAGLWDDEDIDQWFENHRDEEGGIFVMDENEEQMMHLNKEEVKELAEEGDLPPVTEEMEASEPSTNPFEDNFCSIVQTSENVADEETKRMSTEEYNEVPSVEPDQKDSKKPAANNDIFKIWQEMTSKAPTSVAPKTISSQKSPIRKGLGSTEEATTNRAYSTSVTIPDTPEVYKRYRLKQAMKAEHIKTSEDMELEAIAKRRKDAVQVLKMSKDSFNKIRSGKPPGKVVKPEKTAITKVREFKFRTQRKSGETARKPANNVNPSNYPSMLRSAASLSSAPSKTKAAVNVKPFSVATKPRKVNGNFISVAEVVASYQTRTPDRFHSISTKDHVAGPVSHQQGAPVLPSVTKPRSPTLHTRSRARPVESQSQAEKEKQELEEKQRQQFKARPLNSKILDPFYHGMCGVVKEASRPATKPITPKLATAKREALRKRSDKPHPSTTAFRAQEIPKDMFSSVKGVPEKRANAITLPQSPAFHLKKQKVEDSSMSTTASEESISEYSQPEKPVFRPHVEHKHTEIKPFKFEERYQNKPTRDDYVRRKLEEEQRELAEKRNFHAQPVVSAGPLPARPPPQPTRAEPFHLQTDIRGNKYHEDFEKKVQHIQCIHVV